MSKVKVENPQAASVDVEHPSLKHAVRNMVKRGISREEMVKVTGLPSEAVERIERDIRREEK